MSTWATLGACIGIYIFAAITGALATMRYYKVGWYVD